MLNKNSKPFVNHNVMAIPSNENLAIHNLDDDTYALVQGEVGKFIWNHIDSISTVEDIAGLIEQEFDVQYQTALGDLLDLLERLMAMNHVGALDA